jgi:hypothetical protein
VKKAIFALGVSVVIALPVLGYVLTPRLDPSAVSVATAYVASQPQAVASASWFVWSSMDCDGNYEPNEACNDELQSVNLPPKVIEVAHLANGRTRVVEDVYQTTGVPMRFTVLISARGGIISGK